MMKIFRKMLPGQKPKNFCLLLYILNFFLTLIKEKKLKKLNYFAFFRLYDNTVFNASFTFRVYVPADYKIEKNVTVRKK